jgi:hypothetical protein
MGEYPLCCIGTPQSGVAERGATMDEVIATIEQGESLPARLGRTGFRRNFPFGALCVADVMPINKSRRTQSRKMAVGRNYGSRHVLLEDVATIPQPY